VERETLTNILNIAVKQSLANLHTSLIAKVTAVNDSTINCKPVINRVVNDESIELPEFVEVPVITMQGGGSYTIHPIAVDDYCLLIISERCFDRWHSGQDYKDPLELRMHDYSDAIAIVGLNPLSSAITIPTETTENGNRTQIGEYTHTGDRTQTGDITLTGNYTQVGDMEITGDVLITGNLTVTGTIAAGNFTGIGGGTMTSTSSIETTGEMTASGVSLSSHTHDYTWTSGAGSSTTSAPN